MDIVTAAIEAVLENKGRCVVAIDGGSGSGKSTLADGLARRFSANVTHADDFFLQAHQRTSERLAEPGGNLDRERLRSEVLEGIASGMPYRYRIFDCGDMTLGEYVTVYPTSVEIIEGSYSHHPDLRGFYDLTVWLECDLETRLARIKMRNPSMFDRFRDIWIPMETRYAEAYDVRKNADIRTTNGRSL